MKFSAALVLALLALTGCAGAESETPSISPTQAYVENLREGHPEDTVGVPDSKLIEVGRATCATLDSGTSIEEIGQASYEAGLDPYLVGGVLGAAVKDLCPRHQDTVDAWLEQ